MVSKKYLQERGDLVWIDFDPQDGREQAGRRPAVVLSPRFYNEKSALAWSCPITSKAKGYLFEVPLPKSLPLQGVVMADQLRSLDYQQRQIEFIGCLPSDEKVYNGLHRVIGRGNISQFIEGLVRPHVISRARREV